MADPHPPIVIFGDGGHADVVAFLAADAGFVVAKRLAAPAAGGPTDEAELAAAVERGDAVAVALGHNGRRHALVAAAVALGADAPALVHCTATNRGTTGPGATVHEHAHVGAAAQIGVAAIVNTGAIVEHHCVVGSGAHVAPGARLGGAVSVGEQSLIGIGAIVRPGVRIGRHVTVGAGAVVVDDLDDGCTVVGNPARTIRGAP